MTTTQATEWVVVVVDLEAGDEDGGLGQVVADEMGTEAEAQDRAADIAYYNAAATWNIRVMTRAEANGLGIE